MSEFAQEAERIKENIFKEKIRILIWGPGKPKSNASLYKQRAYNKRVQIKRVLRKKFRNGEVYFSEDKKMKGIAKEITGKLEKEAFQAKIADLILVLAISRGANLELDHFIPTYPWFREKVRILLPKKYIKSQGLASSIYEFLRPNQIEGFTTQEFNRCKLATEKAVRIAKEAVILISLRR